MCNVYFIRVYIRMMQGTSRHVWRWANRLGLPGKVRPRIFWGSRLSPGEEWGGRKNCEGGEKLEDNAATKFWVKDKAQWCGPSGLWIYSSPLGHALRRPGLLAGLLGRNNISVMITNFQFLLLTTLSDVLLWNVGCVCIQQCRNMKRVNGYIHLQQV